MAGGPWPRLAAFGSGQQYVQCCRRAGGAFGGRLYNSTHEAIVEESAGGVLHIVLCMQAGGATARAVEAGERGVHEVDWGGSSCKSGVLRCCTVCENDKAAGNVSWIIILLRCSLVAAELYKLLLNY